MPTYEYECSACGARFEEFQSISSSPLRTCRSCGKRKIRRLIGSGSGIIFRGSGFHETDYRSEDYKRKQKADQDGGGAGSGAKDKKGDKKPESGSGEKKASQDSS